jgi:cytochrome c-type biogenesis protein CcmH/NrfG
MLRHVPEVSAAPAPVVAAPAAPAEAAVPAPDMDTNPRLSGAPDPEPNAAVPEPSAVPPAENPEAAFDEPLPSSAAAANDKPVVTASDAEGYETLLAQARKQGYRRSAESSYLQALSILPEGAQALSGLAMLYLNLGKNVDARNRAQAAIKADPTNSEAWIVLGAASSSLGDTAAANEAYARCAALSTGKYVAECRRMVR